MKNLSHNQHLNLVDFIYDLYEKNNPELEDNVEISNQLIDDIEICLSEFFDNLRAQQESHN